MTLLLLAACAEAPAPAAPAWSYPLDDVLRLTDAQVAGTHNSYHLAPDPYVVAEWDYSHAPLDVQLAEQGVRQFELDVHQEDGEWPVYHVDTLDPDATCATLADCLDVVSAWSDANPAHLPITVLLEPKDDTGGDEITDWDGLEATIRAHGPDAVTPAEVRGDAATLREAVTTAGWPVLGTMRGRAIYALLDRAEKRDAYRARGEGLLFLTPDAEDDDAALLLMDDPSAQDIAATVAQGFLVRTRADDGTQAESGDTTRLGLALESGAQLVSTDYPAPVDGLNYFVEIPGGTPARCDPVTAPPECTSEALEDPAFLE